MVKRKRFDFRILFFLAVILIAGLTTFFIIKRIHTNDKQVKGVFVLEELGKRL